MRFDAPAPKVQTRDASLKQSGDRVAIDTDSLKGSIALKGARIDDVLLVKYRETVDPKSPPDIRPLAAQGGQRLCAASDGSMRHGVRESQQSLRTLESMISIGRKLLKFSVS